MPEKIIRPSLKFIKAGYLITLVIVLATAGLAVRYEQPVWEAAIALFLFVWPIERHLHRQITKISILEDKLRYETGLLSKTTRTIQLPKVQDVTVQQRLSQRIFGVGDLSIETAGETSRLTVMNIDAPQVIADEIIAFSQKGQKGQSA
ncbi:MAG: PH domain-containing protein [Acidobacteria bacterium]|nr:PH domain-containing protein [Acidobacteriota bacterium]